MLRGCQGSSAALQSCWKPEGGPSAAQEMGAAGARLLLAVLRGLRTGMRQDYTAIARLSCAC